MEICFFVTAFVAILAVGNVNSQAIVEILIVMDDYSYDQWADIATQAENSVYDEVYSMFAEANLVITAGLGIELRVSEVGIVKFNGDILADAVVDEATNAIDIYVAVDLFISYANWNLRDVYPYDVAVMLVGHNITNTDGDVIYGGAYNNGMCSEKNVAVVKSEYVYKQVRTLYHELGHLLGAYHDGDGNDCPAEEGWAMTPYHSVESLNYFEFSECSQDQINTFLETNYASCVYSTNGSELISAERFGRLVDGNEQCRRAFSPEAFAVQNYPRGYEICHLYMCETLDASIIENMITPQGMACGPVQSCNLGQCTDDPTVPDDIDPYCLFGDSPYIIFFLTTCEDVVAVGLCEVDGVEREFCCASCAESVIIGK